MLEPLFLDAGEADSGFSSLKEVPAIAQPG